MPSAEESREGRSGLIKPAIWTPTVLAVASLAVAPLLFPLDAGGDFFAALKTGVFIGQVWVTAAWGCYGPKPWHYRVPTVAVFSTLLGYVTWWKVGQTEAFGYYPTAIFLAWAVVLGTLGVEKQLAATATRKPEPKLDEYRNPTARFQFNLATLLVVASVLAVLAALISTVDDLLFGVLFWLYSLSLLAAPLFFAPAVALGDPLHAGKSALLIAVVTFASTLPILVLMLIHGNPMSKAAQDWAAYGVITVSATLIVTAHACELPWAGYRLS